MGAAGRVVEAAREGREVLVWWRMARRPSTRAIPVGTASSCGGRPLPANRAPWPCAKIPGLVLLDPAFVFPTSCSVQGSCKILNKHPRETCLEEAASEQVSGLGVSSQFAAHGTPIGPWAPCLALASPDPLSSPGPSPAMLNSRNQPSWAIDI